MVRCAITDLKGYGDDPERGRARLLVRAKDWIVDRIELIQLREKDLEVSALLSLAEDLMKLAAGSETKVLINSRVDVAVAAGAHGVHLTSAPGQLSPNQVRRVFAGYSPTTALISVSCHSVAEVERAANEGADWILFGPVFEKRVGSSLVGKGVGLASLRDAVRAAGAVPVLALGGVDRECFQQVLDVGCAGVAGIRVFA